jgi:hypothetical protein
LWVRVVGLDAAELSKAMSTTAGASGVVGVGGRISAEDPPLLRDGRLALAGDAEERTALPLCIVCPEEGMYVARSYPGSPWCHAAT